jgi:hypothetical protein
MKSKTLIHKYTTHEMYSSILGALILTIHRGNCFHLASWWNEDGVALRKKKKPLMPLF